MITASLTVLCQHDLQQTGQVQAEVAISSWSADDKLAQDWQAAVGSAINALTKSSWFSPPL